MIYVSEFDALACLIEPLTARVRCAYVLVIVCACGLVQPAHAQLTTQSFDQGEFTLHYGARQPLTPIAFDGVHVAIRPLCTERPEGVSCGFRITAMSSRLALVRTRSVTVVADGNRTSHPARGHLTQTDANQDIELLVFQVPEAVFARIASAEDVEIHVGPDIVVRYDADRQDIAALLPLHDRRELTAQQR